MSAAKGDNTQGHRSGQSRSNRATRGVLSNAWGSELSEFPMLIGDCAPVLYTLRVITSSNVLGAFQGPDGVGFYVGVPFTRGTLGCWEAGERGSARGPGEWRRAERAGSRYLGQEAEVSAQDGFVGVMEELQEAARQEVEGVGHGQLRKELLLLRLEVQDFGLRVAEGKKVQGLEDCYVPCPPSHVPSAPKP